MFSAGNEGNVANYVNNTGLMWELAQELGALLVFAEVLPRTAPVTHWQPAGNHCCLCMGLPQPCTYQHAPCTNIDMNLLTASILRHPLLQHRYYSSSQPAGGNRSSSLADFQFLSVDQALLDYVNLIEVSNPLPNDALLVPRAPAGP